MEFSLATAKSYDRSDPLAHFRRRFHIPKGRNGKPQLYLCGHSLGLMPRGATKMVKEELDRWAKLGVEGHFQGKRPWYSYHHTLEQGLSELTGARADEIVAMNSLTVNLHLMLVAFYRPEGKRRRIVIEADAFPSDRYAIKSQLEYHGADPERDLIELPAGPKGIDAKTLEETLQQQRDRVALVLMPGVQYLSGQVLPMAAMTRAARRHNVPIGLDLAHAIGNVPLQLGRWGPDFAVWCSYKYLNGGPGAPGGCFVHRRWHNQNLPRFAGWWGHDEQRRFQMPQQFQPITGAQGFQLSNPPILAMAPLLASLDLFRQAGLPALRNKAIALTQLLRAGLRDRLASQVEVLTPNPAGCQLSLRLRRPAAEARRVFEQLMRKDVIADWRAPNIIRMAPIPLYTRFQEVYRAVTTLEGLLR